MVASVLQATALVAQHFLEWAGINHGLIALEARASFALERLRGHRAEFNAPTVRSGRSPRLKI